MTEENKTLGEKKVMAKDVTKAKRKKVTEEQVIKIINSFGNGLTNNQLEQKHKVALSAITKIKKILNNISWMKKNEDSGTPVGYYEPKNIEQMIIKYQYNNNLVPKEVK